MIKIRMFLVSFLIGIGAVATLTNLPVLAQSSLTKSTLPSFETAVKLAIEPVVTVEQARDLNNQVSRLIRDQEYQKAFLLAQKISAALEEAYNKNPTDKLIAKQVVDCVNNLASLHELYRKDFATAEHFYGVAINIGGIHNLPTVARSWRYAGNLRERKGDDEYAERFYLKSLELATKRVLGNHKPGKYRLRRPIEYYARDYMVDINDCGKSLKQQSTTRILSSHPLL